MIEVNPIYRVLAGSRGFGLEKSTSDYDKKVIFMPTADQILSFGYEDHHREVDQNIETEYFSLRKFLKLALNSNPTILEMLFLEPEYISIKMLPILKDKEELLSKKCFYSFGGYARDQFKKIERTAHRGVSEKYDTKAAMHCFRLLSLGASILRGERFFLWQDQRYFLREIRDGLFELKDIRRIFEEKDCELKKDFRDSRLPEEPNYVFFENIFIYMQKKEIEASFK